MLLLIALFVSFVWASFESQDLFPISESSETSLEDEATYSWTPLRRRSSRPFGRLVNRLLSRDSPDVPLYWNRVYSHYASSDNYVKPLIIIDFDDTLFPTTEVGLKLERVLTPEQQSEATTTAVRLITAASEFGDVVILTASCPEFKWPSFATATHLPGLTSILENTKILYCRDTGFFSKGVSFKSLLLERLRETPGPQVVISLSDAQRDTDDFKVIASQHPEIRARAIQFAVLPTVDQLTAQLRFATEQLPRFLCESLTSQFMTYYFQVGTRDDDGALGVSMSIDKSDKLDRVEGLGGLMKNPYHTDEQFEEMIQIVQHEISKYEAETVAAAQTVAGAQRVAAAETVAGAEMRSLSVTTDESSRFSAKSELPMIRPSNPISQTTSAVSPRPRRVSSMPVLSSDPVDDVSSESPHVPAFSARQIGFLERPRVTDSPRSTLEPQRGLHQSEIRTGDHTRVRAGSMSSSTTDDTGSSSSPNPVLAPRPRRPQPLSQGTLAGIVHYRKTSLMGGTKL